MWDLDIARLGETVLFIDSVARVAGFISTNFFRIATPPLEQHYL
jgi:hypothetical protein